VSLIALSAGRRWFRALCRPLQTDACSRTREISTLDARVHVSFLCVAVDVPHGAMSFLIDISAHRRVVTNSQSCQSLPVTPRRLVGDAEAMGGPRA